MSIWEYANPKKFMQTSQVLLPWAAGLSAVCLLVGLVWGFFFTPDDFRQGSTVKIIYLHVPSALMAINAWFMMLLTSLIWLIRRHHVSVLAAKAAAKLEDLAAHSGIQDPAALAHKQSVVQAALARARAQRPEGAPRGAPNDESEHEPRPD